MEAEVLIPLLIPTLFFGMMAAERIWPARRFPAVRGWAWIGIGFFLLLLTLGTLVPLLLPINWLERHCLLPGWKLGVLGGVLVGYPLASLGHALVHRALHHFNFLWRWFHQMHHAPVRVDIAGAVLFHPFEMILNNLVSISITTFVLGLEAEATAWTSLLALFYGLFQHWNVRTPQWLGYLIQRPESHCIHHQRDLHAYNYSDFPPWDMLMGTWRNPATHESEAGFGGEASRRYGAMLLGRDVNPALDNGGGGAIA